MPPGRGPVPRPVPALARGYTLVELMFVLGLAFVIGAAAMPQVTAGLDHARTRGAARYLASTMASARAQAVLRSTNVAVRFVALGDDMALAGYVDGNNNGVRTAEIVSGVDPPWRQATRLSDLYPGVRIDLVINGAPADPVQFGANNLVSFAPSGGATSGTVYVRGRQGTQFAVRVLGATGRVRLLRYDPHSNDFIDAF